LNEFSLALPGRSCCASASTKRLGIVDDNVVLHVVKSWLSYRMKEGAGKRSSPLDEIRPERWPASFTEELCRQLWIVEQTLDLIPKVSELLDKIVDGPIFDADELPSPTGEERAAPKTVKDESEQLTMGAESE
jgi:hypothetical protein